MPPGPRPLRPLPCTGFHARLLLRSAARSQERLHDTAMFTRKEEPDPGGFDRLQAFCFEAFRMERIDGLRGLDELDELGRYSAPQPRLLGVV